MLHDDVMETFSITITLWEKPSVVDGFPTEKSSIATFWDNMTLKWRHCNGQHDLSARVIQSNTSMPGPNLPKAPLLASLLIR